MARVRATKVAQILLLSVPLCSCWRQGVQLGEPIWFPCRHGAAALPVAARDRAPRRKGASAIMLAKLTPVKRNHPHLCRGLVPTMRTEHRHPLRWCDHTNALLLHLLRFTRHLLCRGAHLRPRTPIDAKCRQALGHTVVGQCIEEGIGRGVIGLAAATQQPGRRGVEHKEVELDMRRITQPRAYANAKLLALWEPTPYRSVTIPVASARHHPACLRRMDNAPQWSTVRHPLRRVALRIAWRRCPICHICLRHGHSHTVGGQRIELLLHRWLRFAGVPVESGGVPPALPTSSAVCKPKPPRPPVTR